MSTASPTTPAFPTHRPSIPYLSKATSLQTLDLWLPQSHDPSSTSPWVIYIHGGAWRDPLQTSTTIHATLSHLHNPPSSPIAGIASINYRLSPYASHPTAPSDPHDAARNVRHPSHVRDVAAALRYLRAEHGVERWIGVGHSCGATLLLQYVAGIGLDDVRGRNDGLEALVLLEGIYDVPLMLRNHVPPGCPEGIARIYREFVEGAFGEGGDEVYRKVSPVAGAYGRESVGRGLKLVALGYSAEDELVESEQREAMLRVLKGDGWVDSVDEIAEGKGLVECRDLQGAHDWIWEDGRQIAAVIEEVVGRIHQWPKNASTMHE
ncbi:alpha/beta-hydrolase [Aaosphaeria arxii CBS 175.79]|uniref:Kynurenine formamidase n=1 Tax=Aaosphaeria arxii CBS 175.79 TaxID=1450172 RepID=A0A6A5Y270_9PLEO|nr:alpha/beta-hydrolase [Aaosphaeria arxii CBS 175.79]KAF2019137.1 alpha/beta-hydrolase [Aaosphaeria arxii CBS 175.79]